MDVSGSLVDHTVLIYSQTGFCRSFDTMSGGGGGGGGGGYSIKNIDIEL